jgi:flavin-dependent dehydrogenase
MSPPLDAPSAAPAEPIVAETCDVLVIGGGPSGSTAAALLAERGIDVVLLEKEHHPRFHVGESLLPRNMQVLDRLGVRDRVAAMGVHKPGAEFVLDETGQSTKFDFGNSLNKRYTFAYQVRRAQFDEMLFETARERGARALMGMRVTDVSLGAGGVGTRVTAVDDGGQAHVFMPRFVLDASGRDTFMANRLRTKESNKDNNTAAVFAHFRGVETRTGDLEGYITVHLVDDGWFWMIPLPNGVMSVGFVGTQAAFKQRRGTMVEFFEQRLRASPMVSARMIRAERIGDVEAAGNYSYRARAAHGDGYMMIGDAFAFLDPIFSSGVLLAMTTGERGADVAATWLENPSAARALARKAEKSVRAEMKSLSWLVYRINTPVLRYMFMSPKNTFRMRDGIVTLLTGNLGYSPKLIGPVIALKLVFYFVSFMHRLGWRDPSIPPPRAAMPTLAADAAD